MAKKLKNLDKIPMNDVQDHDQYFPNLIEFYFRLVLKNMLGDNRKNHHDFLKLIVMNPKKILKQLIKYNLFLILIYKKKNAKEIRPVAWTIKL